MIHISKSDDPRCVEPQDTHRRQSCNDRRLRVKIRWNRSTIAAACSTACASFSRGDSHDPWTGSQALTTRPEASDSRV